MIDENFSASSFNFNLAVKLQVDDSSCNIAHQTIGIKKNTITVEDHVLL